MNWIVMRFQSAPLFKCISVEHVTNLVSIPCVVDMPEGADHFLLQPVQLYLLDTSFFKGFQYLCLMFLFTNFVFQRSNVDHYVNGITDVKVEFGCSMFVRCQSVGGIHFRSEVWNETKGFGKATCKVPDSIMCGVL